MSDRDALSIPLSRTITSSSSPVPLRTLNSRMVPRSKQSLHRLQEETKPLNGTNGTPARHVPTMQAVRERAEMWRRKDGADVVGLRRTIIHDLYHHALTVSWPKFMVFVIVVLLGQWSTFAGLYMIEPGGVANARPGIFLDHFSFSVQTSATIGYGVMYPNTPFTVVLMTIEVLTGILSTSIVTGLAFARISKPTARILFSDFAVVRSVHGVPTLMFRAGNKRRNHILHANVEVSLLRDTNDSDLGKARRFLPLELVRSTTPVFSMTWTILHKITPDSPLYGHTPASLAECNAEIIVLLSGEDISIGNSITARHSYLDSEIRWNTGLVDIVSEVEGQGRRRVNYRKFHDLFAILPGEEGFIYIESEGNGTLDDAGSESQMTEGEVIEI